MRFRRIDPGVVIAAGFASCALTAWVTISGSSSDAAGLEAVARVLMVATPVAVGLYARRRPPFERFGALLIAAGFGWFLATLSGSSNELLYSVGRVSGWLIEVGLVYLVVAFPSGRLQDRTDRILVWSAALIVAVLYLPTALLVDQYPVPSPWTTCDAGCPHNAFDVAGSDPGFVEAVVLPLRELLTVALFAAVTARLAARMTGTRSLVRRALAPVLTVAILRLVVLATAIVARRVAPDSAFVDVCVWLIALAVPAMAGAFLIGLAVWGLFVAGAVRRLATSLPAHAAPEDLRATLAEAFDDPSLQIAYWLRDRDGTTWADPYGHPVRMPRPESGRCLTEVHDGERRVAAIIHDVALRNERAFIDAASSYAVITLDNHRLSAEAASLVREVQASRARIQAAADEERRRIERDLHDGAQQQLVALRIKLELEAERTNGNGGSAARLRSLGADVEQALDEVRALARGIYPSPLADRGLVDALRSAALRAGVPTTVLATAIRRYPLEIESAAYFCCLEALQNVAKHARGASVAVVDLTDDGALRLEVRDDGDGFDAEHAVAGVGLTSMRDRVAAVGGRLAIVSSPGRGTRVSADIPLGGR